MTDDAFTLNLRARFALAGSSLDWRADLAALLRSDAPIDQLLREALAAAVADPKNDGPRLDLRNVGEQANRFDAIRARHEWMRIGAWISLLRREGMKDDEAIEATSQHFGVTEGKCKKALPYYQKAAPILEAALETDPGKSIGRELLENMYHHVFAYPKDRTFADRNADLLRQLGIPHLSAVGGSASE